MPSEHGSTTRAHVVLPTDLLAAVDRLVGRRARSRFVAEAIAEKVARLRQRRLLTAAAGALAAREIPGWDDGAAWVHQLRAQDASRRRPEGGSDAEDEGDAAAEVGPPA
jgi:hypothetical protein